MLIVLYIQHANFTLITDTLGTRCCQLLLNLGIDML